MTYIYHAIFFLIYLDILSDIKNIFKMPRKHSISIKILSFLRQFGLQIEIKLFHKI